MSDTNLYWNLRGTYDERRKKLAEFSREYLEAAILDAEYNDFLRDRVAIIDEAMRLNSEGGNLAEINAKTRAKLDELWDLLDGFKIGAAA